MKHQFFDLAFEQNEDGIIRLTQNDFGEPVYIDLHPQQLAFVAQAFEKQPPPSGTTSRPCTPLGSTAARH